MKNDFEKVKQTLTEISKRIDERSYEKLPLESEWGGANVIITSEAKEIKSGGFYPPKRMVVTPFSGELAWLFDCLRDAFSGWLDSASRDEFYGRLANAATNYQTSVNGDGDSQDILKAVLYEAVVMLEEIEEGTFEYLLVAPGNTILADLVEKSEESGYIGVEATNEFFKRMEERHREP